MKHARAMISPFVDALCCGGLSIVCVVAYIIYRQYVPLDPENPHAMKDLMVVVALQVLINNPHFMASYRILYGSRQKISAHRWCSYYLPAIMIGLTLLAVVTRNAEPIVPIGDFGLEVFNQDIFMMLFAVSIVYLAWHYTGQAWGMTASFLAIGGAKMKIGRAFSHPHRIARVTDHPHHPMGRTTASRSSPPLGSVVSGPDP